MDLDEVRELIRQLMSLVEELPEPYRAATYGVLLNHLLISQEVTSEREVTAPRPDIQSTAAPFSVPIGVRAFFQQYGIDEGVLQKLFLIQGTQIVSIYTITTRVKAKAQIQVALLKALENALITQMFSFQQKDVREKLDELRLYDSTNFSSNFRSKSTLFKNLDSEEVELSGDGKSELAGVILELGK